MARSARGGWNPPVKIARLHSLALHGIESVPIEVEVDVARRGFAGKESSERGRSEMLNSGYQFSRYQTVVDLAAAELRRAGSILELATGVGIIIASGNVVVDGPTTTGGRRTGSGRADAPSQRCPVGRNSGRSPRLPRTTATLPKCEGRTTSSGP